MRLLLTTGNYYRWANVLRFFSAQRDNTKKNAPEALPDWSLSDGLHSTLSPN